MAEGLNQQRNEFQPMASRTQFLAAEPSSFDGEAVGGNFDADRTLSYYGGDCPKFHIDIVGKGDHCDGRLEVKIRGVDGVPDSVQVWVETPVSSRTRFPGARILTTNRFEVVNVPITDLDVQQKICEILAEDAPILTDR
ncbi:hypothetical protein [Comamonas koreensis]|uniref:hypothetical protein n=1 Tax=Comamonas koreensis TaxID=160825 RepID=UPI0015F78861|nr:hypothetical protein [Comamonas koreensis]